MRNRVLILLAFAMCLIIGCLGGGGGGGGSSSLQDVLTSTAPISGNVFYASTSLYGGIAIQAKDINDAVVANTTTDPYGNFSFTDLEPGVYSLYATTGESEVNFMNGVQVIKNLPVSIPSKSLIELTYASLDRITSTSVRIAFTSSVPCISQIEYNAAGANTSQQTVNSSYETEHQITITGLTPTTRYNFILKLQSQTGQSFKYSSLSATTLSAIGPSNLSLKIEDGDISTRFTSVKLNIEADNASQMRIGTSENLADLPWISYSTIYDYNLTPGDGTKRLYIQFRDAFGNTSSIINDSILLQSDVSGHIGVWINGGKGITNDNNVILSFLYPGASKMMVSDSPDFLNSFWEIFTSSRRFKFSTGDGPKTIYVKFQGAGADPEKVYTATIQLDTTGPEVTMKINDGALKTNNINVTLNFTPVQTPANMMVSMDSAFTDLQWIPYTNNYKFLISKTDGDKKIYAKFEDDLGNVFGPISAQIELDTTPPDSTEFTINNDATETNSLNVTLAMSANDASNIMISNNENFTGATVEKYKTIKTWVLGGYGAQSVYMTFIDDASNSSPVLTKSITVNVTAPSSSSVQINEDDPTTDKIANSLTIYSDTAVNIRLSTNQNFGTLPDTPFVPNIGTNGMLISNYVFPPKAGEQSIYVRYKDASGTYSIASDKITFIGPASYSLTSVDTQPLSTYTVNLRPFAIGATEMLLTENYADLELASSTKWQPFSYSYNFTLSSTTGKHTVYAKYRNAGLVETPPLSLDLIVSKISPATPTILINDGDSQTRSSNVQIKVVTTPDYPIMRITNDGIFSSASDVAAGDQPWFIKNVAGVQTVYTRFQNSSTGEYIYAQDTITAIGPASSSINTSESMPLNKDWLTLNLYAAHATDMIVTEDPGIGDLTTGWIPYQTSLVFPLATGTSNHTIYAKFRNSATNYIETVPVSLAVTVNNTSPSGNTAAFRESADPASTELSEVAVGSLPVFLHFGITDANTASVSYKLVSSGNPAPTTYTEVSPPVAPIQLGKSDFSGNGTFNLYYKFADGAGNETPVNIKSIKIDGPMLTISPANVAPLTSGQTQQFTATLENITGSVKWSISPSSPAGTYGSIDTNTGLYTAPTMIRTEANTTITAVSQDDSSDSVIINLTKQIDVVTAEQNFTVGLGKVATIPVTFVNTASGGAIIRLTTPYDYIATFTDVATTSPDFSTDTIATISFTAPTTLPTTNPLSVKVSSVEDPTKQKILYFTILDHDYVNVSPTDTSARLRTGKVTVVANTSDQAIPVNWSLIGSGSLDPLITTTTASGYQVTYYAPSNSSASGMTVKLVASITDGISTYTATTSILLTPYVKTSLLPSYATINAGDTGGVDVQVSVDNATTTEVLWEYVNATTATTTKTWIEVDNAAPPSSPDMGTLVSNGNNVIYYPPHLLDSGLELGPPSTGKPSIFVRATSIDDNAASSSMQILLDPPIEARLYRGFSANEDNLLATSGDDISIATITPVTLEVGNQQFFAKIVTTKTGINNTFKWEIEGQSGTTAYGTIDATGKFTAPDTVSKNQITLRATSNEYTSIYAQAYIQLNNFWLLWSEGLTNDTGDVDSVYSIMIDPTTSETETRTMYCGTNGNGVYVATFPYNLVDPNEKTQVASLTWAKTNLSTSEVASGSGEYIINDIAFGRQHKRVIAATSNGAYLISRNSSDTSQAISFPASFSAVVSALAIDPIDDDNLYIIYKNQGVTYYKWVTGSATYVYQRTLYNDGEPMNSIKYIPAEWKDDAPKQHNFEFPAIATSTASSTMTFTSAVVDPQNPDTLYVSFVNHWYSHDVHGDVFKNGYLKFSDPKNDNFSSRTTLHNVPLTGDLGPASGAIHDIDQQALDAGVASDGEYLISTIDVTDFRHPTGHFVYNYSTGIILSMAIDPNTPTTIWIGKNDGIYRSTDSGTTFTSMGGYTNVRAIFIDPINTVNVYIGTESGLYVTKDAGATWKQIKTGLEGHTTINGLGLSPGAVGTRRIFCGTTGGVFMGRTSLDLQ